MRPADLGTEFVRACTAYGEAARRAMNMPSDATVGERRTVLREEDAARQARDQAHKRYWEAIDLCQCREVYARRPVGAPFCRHCELLLTEAE